VNTIPGLTTVPEWVDGPVVVGRTPTSAQSDPQAVTYSSYQPDGTVIASDVTVPGLEASCGLVAVPSGSTAAIYGITSVQKPAEGLTPAQETVSLTQFSPALEQQWTTTIVTGTVSDLSGSDQTLCDSGHDIGAGPITVTSDQKWIAVNVGSYATHGYVDAERHLFHTTGHQSPSSEMTDGFTLAVGNRIAVMHVTCPGTICDPATFTVTDPATGSAQTYKETLPVYGPGQTFQAFGTSGGAHLDSRGEGIFSAGDDMSQSLYLLDPVTLKLTKINYDKWDRSQHFAVDATTDTVIIDSGASGPGELTAIAIPDGTKRWSANAQLCSAGGGVVLVSANGQLVALDATTGKQLAYSSSLSGCPTRVDRTASHGSYGWELGDNGIQVIKVAT
jgi:outer membrane protein assembly factor BamB